jgi:Protein of unknown function (DUF4058)
MHNPFPGMNPYLENPALWAEVHHRLISAIAIALGPALRPKYRVAIEKRTYLSEGDQAIDVGIPDVAVLTTVKTSDRSSGTVAMMEPIASTQPFTVTLPIAQEVNEGYLEIRDVATGRVVTSIEVLSPTNKRFSMGEATPTGNGRDAYLSKRQRVLGSLTHLVEIDLLRAGRAMEMLTEMPSCHYRILVARSIDRPQAQLYGFNVQQPIPAVPIPLERGDVEPILDLQRLLDEVYEQAGFDLTIDYSQAPIPGLSKEDQSWWTIRNGGES